MVDSPIFNVEDSHFVTDIIAVLPVCVGLDQAGINGKTFSADQSLTDAAPQDRLEHAPQQIALAETAMSVLRKRRIHPIEAKATEPAVCQIEMDLIAQPPLRADAEAIADDQHPDHAARGSSLTALRRKLQRLTGLE
jgi:hypothetical protein